MTTIRNPGSPHYLPTELFTKVLSYIPIPTLYTLSLTNRSFWYFIHGEIDSIVKSRLVKCFSDEEEQWSGRVLKGYLDAMEVDGGRNGGGEGLEMVWKGCVDDASISILDLRPFPNKEEICLRFITHTLFYPPKDSRSMYATTLYMDMDMDTVSSKFFFDTAHLPTNTQQVRLIKLTKYDLDIATGVVDALAGYLGKSVGEVWDFLVGVLDFGCGGGVREHVLVKSEMENRGMWEGERDWRGCFDRKVFCEHDRILSYPLHPFIPLLRDLKPYISTKTLQKYITFTQTLLEKYQTSPTALLSRLLHLDTDTKSGRGNIRNVVKRLLLEDGRDDTYDYRWIEGNAYKTPFLDEWFDRFGGRFDFLNGVFAIKVGKTTYTFNLDIETSSTPTSITFTCSATIPKTKTKEYDLLCDEDLCEVVSHLGLDYDYDDKDILDALFFCAVPWWVDLGWAWELWREGMDDGGN